MTEFWRSLSELEGTAEFDQALAREFGSDVGDKDSGVNRRHFVQIMGASLALAGASGCRWDKDNIHSFTRSPQSHIPGKPKYFASAYDTDGIAQPVMVTSYDYRPIKVDGNPKHPMSFGSSDITTQGTVLELYDPDRSKNVLNDGKKSSWDAFRAFAKEAFKGSGSQVAFITGTYSSPSLVGLVAELKQKLPQATWVTFDGISRDNIRQGSMAAFGKPVRTMLELAQARVILSLDDDFLGAHPAHVKYSRDWATARRPEQGETMSRMYVVESRLSNTGGCADHRLPLRSRDVKAFALAVEQALRQSGVGIEGQSPSPSGLDAEVTRFAHSVAKDLAAHQGSCVVTAGSGQSSEVHAIAHRMNLALGNAGKTVTYLDHGTAAQDGSQNMNLARLIDSMSKGQVETLVVLGGNPVYNAPGSLAFAPAYAKVKNRVHLSEYVDETSSTATWHLNAAHWLETWGDSRSYDGTVTVQQPMIRPLYDGKSAIEVASLILAATQENGVAENGYTLVRRTFGKLTGHNADDKTLAAAVTADYDSQGPVPEGSSAAAEPKLPVTFNAFDRAWRQSLFDGVVNGTAFAKTTPALQPFTVSAPDATASRADVKNGELELTFYVDSRMGDGRHSNNAWLQETPDFMTKLTWDNALLVGPATAKALSLEDEGMVKISVNGRELTVPVLVQPGQAMGSAALALGYGRTAAGRVGGWKERELDHTVAGFDANVLRGTETVSFVAGAKVAPTGERFKLATTVDHFLIDQAGMKERERRAGEIIRIGTIDDYKHEPDFAKHVVHHPPLESLFKEWEYGQRRWGMAIDLTSCTGCSACVVACTAENNVPVVGKEQVLRNREMHWIRIDRYFQGDPENPKLGAQPMLCQQCENAPCEQVCPVGATIHTQEGLNDMVYNRCIGTRYCSNNCPYKVRRFNYFNFHEDLKDGRNEVKKMMNNPEVTVRFRGVMEKCTYCVQRIQNTKIVANNEKRRIKDGEITPACAQACPTDAIVFGDLSDPNARVNKLKALPRNYDVLAELNVKPRTSYLAKITNPNGGLVS
ncbi:MAG: TAT-variant-translocated molybdopterin oxidoreductase [Myxococcota bacterium]